MFKQDLALYALLGQALNLAVSSTTDNRIRNWAFLNYGCRGLFPASPGPVPGPEFCFGLPGAAVSIRLPRPLERLSCATVT